MPRLEVETTSLEDARDFIDGLGLSGGNVDDLFPDFNKNYMTLKRWASIGKTLRKDMPRIPRSQVKDFQKALKSGELDIAAPFSPFTKANGKFNAGKDHASFLRAGKDDGKKNDDKVSSKFKKIAAEDLKPIQKQIYLDAAVGEKIRKLGIKGFITLTKNANLIVSSDNFIIDGHHRVATSLLIDPKMKLKSLIVDLSINKLLKLAHAYGEAKGNKPNESVHFTGFCEYLQQIV